MDGLEPSDVFVKRSKGLGVYKEVYQAFVRPNEETPLKSEAYDVLMCSAGMFPGAIEPQAFQEFIRVVKPGGYMLWNVAQDYKNFNKFFESYDEILEDLVKQGKWKYHQKPKVVDNLLFSDSGHLFIMQKL